MITKKRLKKHIEQFPEEMSIDELIDRLVFIEKLENRIKQSKDDDTISEADLENEMKECSK